jgi:low temperature requirement protein LtrA
MLQSALRDRGGDRVVHVTNMELFFDLVYVFAFIELSQHLYQDLTLRGGAEMLVMFIAVWWGWNGTAWATGWIDPERIPVVLLLSVVMLLSLVVATAIPDAFTDRGLTFACGYVAMQLLRSGFMVAAFGIRSTMGRNYAQLLAWAVVSGVVWIVGGIVHDENLRLLIWATAAAIDLAAPLHGYWLPGAGSTPMSQWSVAGGHLAERCQLLLMVAFGETVLRLGEAFVLEHGRVDVAAAFVFGYVLTFALWSVYFLHHAEEGAAAIRAAAADTARLGRSAYAYAHAVMIESVLVVAVAIHDTIEAPTEHASTAFTFICLGAPALYLIGIALSKRWLGRGRIRPPLVGGIALALLGIPAALDDRLTTLIAAAVVAVAISIWARLEPERQPAAA